jgi:integrase
MSRPSLSGLREIIPSREALDAMGRRRHQAPTLKRSKTKDGKADRWWFRGYIDIRSGPGQTERIEKSYHLGYCSAMGKREAQAAMDKKVADLNRPAEILQSQVRFGEVLDKWLAMADVRENTATGYKSVVEAHIRPRWGDVRMCDITTLAVEEWIMATARGLAENSVTHIRRRFSQIWKCAIRWDFTSAANPMGLIPKPRNYGKSGRRKTLPTLEQFHRLLAELKPLHREIVTFAVGTGLRVSEILAVRWRQLGGPYLVIEESMDPRGRLGPVKTKLSNRTIPVRHLRLVRPLDACPDDFVFPTNYDSVQRAVQVAATAIEIYYPGLNMHTFRRMHNTWFRRSADGRLHLAQQQLGHADQAINDLYYIADDSDLAARADIAEAMMGKVMGGVQ